MSKKTSKKVATETSEENIPILQKITSHLSPFFEENDINEFANKPVDYIGGVGIIDGKPLYKFGNSDNIVQRISQLKGKYGDQFVIIYAILSDNNVVVESKFKSLVTHKGLMYSMKINGNNETELFTTTNDFTLKDAKKH